MIVVDASVALKWVLDEPGSAAAVRLRDQELAAPVLWIAEAANALWRRVRLGQITPGEATNLLSELGEAPVASRPMEPYIERALQLALAAEHPIYDCLYLALALDRDTHVVTADRRFAAAAERAGMAERVRLLSN